MTNITRPPHDSPSARQPVLFWVWACVGLIAFPALLQFVLHPLLSAGSPKIWALYWLYTLLGVVLPGTMIAISTIRWRADWLTWIGIGWALGHSFELVSYLLAKQWGYPILFLC